MSKATGVVDLIKVKPFPTITRIYLTVYVDLVKCWEYVERNLSFADTSNAVALGASFGGYMINWVRFLEFICTIGLLIVLVDCRATTREEIQGTRLP
jgi:hypothetical protein